jgi:hypothetical protein
MFNEFIIQMKILLLMIMSSFNDSLVFNLKFKMTFRERNIKTKIKYFELKFIRYSSHS